MTSATIAAEGAVVTVLGFVATVAIGGQFHFIHSACGMAGITPCARVTARQLEMGLAIVIEAGVLPVVHPVAKPAA